MQASVLGTVPAPRRQLFVVLVAAFGSVPGDSTWNPNADLDGDEEVTLFDFGILVKNFGKIGDE
jgi:hypothetical protein